MLYSRLRLVDQSGVLVEPPGRGIDWTDMSVGFPALLTITIMPFTYSITNGIGAGFITYVFLQAATGKARRVHPLLWFVALAFLVYFLLPIINAQLA